MLTRWGILLLATSLSACANSGNQPGNSLATAPVALTLDEAKQIVLAERARLWKDPYSMRDVRIGQPYSCAGGLAHVTNMPNVCVCVEANARNSFGGYTGLKRTEILMNGRQIVDVMEAREATYSCGAMAPFPEMTGNAAPPAPAPAKRG